MSRDMTQKQFDAALKRHGMVDLGFMGYVRIKSPVRDAATNVSAWNAGDRRRDQLAYLIKAKDRYEAEEYAIAKGKEEAA